MKRVLAIRLMSYLPFEKKNKKDSKFKIIFHLPPLGLNFKGWLLSLSIWPSIEVTFISYS